MIIKIDFQICVIFINIDIFNIANLYIRLDVNITTRRGMIDVLTHIRVRLYAKQE